MTKRGRVAGGLAHFVTHFLLLEHSSVEASQHVSPSLPQGTLPACTREHSSPPASDGLPTGAIGPFAALRHGAAVMPTNRCRCGQQQAGVACNRLSCWARHCWQDSSAANTSA